jgi:hypothetical protein
MLKRVTVVALVLALSLVLAAPALAGGGPPPRDEDGNRVRVAVYVLNQGLFYDSIVGPALPPEGEFQELVPPDHPDNVSGYLETEFGPGDPGYLGGRWWVDANDNEVQDDGDAFFSCPLLGKGSAEPPPE